MLTAGILIETLPGRALEVEDQLSLMPEMRVRSEPGGSHLRGLCAVPESESLDAFFSRIAEAYPAIVSIAPTFVVQ